MIRESQKKFFNPDKPRTTGDSYHFFACRVCLIVIIWSGKTKGVYEERVEQIARHLVSIVFGAMTHYKFHSPPLWKDIIRPESRRKVALIAKQARIEREGLNVFECK